MELKDNLNRATALKNELDNIRPLSNEQEKKIWQKFRLDWNFHSSKIEGNSLSYGETKALILFNQTAQAKPLKDHLEMSGHDEAIKYIEEIVNQQRPLTETFIRELHKIILKQPYQVNALTPDGAPTKKWVNIGMYKTTPNHVKTQTGEMFYFASPEETPAKMSDLMSWFSIENKKDSLHPVIFSTEFHYRFVRIHPFDDGNGRIARLLMNFILLQKGYPPAIIKTEEKENYYRALQQADAGQLDYFFNFICEQVNYSLELMLKAARGEEIDESDDLDKKLQLLKMRLGNDPKSKLTVRRNNETIKKVIEKSLFPLVEDLEEQIAKFDSLFKDREIQIKYGNTTVRKNNFRKGLSQIFNDYINKDLVANKHIYPINFDSKLLGLVNSDPNLNIKGLSFTLEFFQNVYELKGNGIKHPLNKLYDDYFKKDEIKDIVGQLLNWQYLVLKNSIDKLIE